MGMPIRKNKSVAYIYRYRGPVWVDDIDPVWIRWPRKGHHSTSGPSWNRSLSRTVMIPSGIIYHSASRPSWNRSLSRTVMIPSGIIYYSASRPSWNRSLSRTVMIPSGIIYYSAFGPSWTTVSYSEYSASGPSWTTVSYSEYIAPSGPHGFLYPLLRFMQA